MSQTTTPSVDPLADIAAFDGHTAMLLRAVGREIWAGDRLLCRSEPETATELTYPASPAEAVANAELFAAAPALLSECIRLRAAVAALIARNAEMEAVKERLIADIRKRDTAIHAWADQARKSESERDALAAENKALREDAERYRWLRDVSVPPHNFYISVPVEFTDVRYTPAEVDKAIAALARTPAKENDDGKLA